MDVCHTDTYDNFNLNNQEEYKGEFFNNNDDDDELKFFEFGAHFPYELLYKRLEELAKKNNNTQISKVKCFNVNAQKSRNINSTNNNNTSNHNNKEGGKSTGKYIMSVGVRINSGTNNIVKNKNNKSTLAISSLTVMDKKPNQDNNKKIPFKNLLHNHINHIPIKSKKDSTTKPKMNTNLSKGNKANSKQHLSCSYQNINKVTSPHLTKGHFGISSIKFQKIQTTNTKIKNSTNKSRNVSKNNNVTSSNNKISKNINNENKSFNKNENSKKELKKTKPHSVEKLSKRSVIKSAITSSLNHNCINNISLSSFKKITHNLSSSLTKEKKVEKEKPVTQPITTSSTSPPSHNIHPKSYSRNYKNCSVIKNSIISSSKNKTQLNNTKKSTICKKKIMSNTISQSLPSGVKAQKKIMVSSKTKK